MVIEILQLQFIHKVVVACPLCASTDAVVDVAVMPQRPVPAVGLNSWNDGWIFLGPAHRCRAVGCVHRDTAPIIRYILCAHIDRDMCATHWSAPQPPQPPQQQQAVYPKRALSFVCVICARWTLAGDHSRVASLGDEESNGSAPCCGMSGCPSLWPLPRSCTALLHGDRRWQGPGERRASCTTPRARGLLPPGRQAQCTSV